MEETSKGKARHDCLFMFKTTQKISGMYGVVPQGPPADGTGAQGSGAGATVTPLAWLLEGRCSHLTTEKGGEVQGKRRSAVSAPG